MIVFFTQTAPKKPIKQQIAAHAEGIPAQGKKKKKKKK